MRFDTTLKTKLRVTPLVLLAGLTAAPSGAQVAPAPHVGAVAATPGYRIAAGDVLGVSVVNFPNLSTPQAMVTPDGTVSLPLLDQVSVTGLTQEQVTRLLANKWRKYVIGPAVTVSLVQKHAQTVVLNGSLNHTGTIDYKPGLHLLDALAQMGGSLPSADATRAVLTHEDGTKVPLDLSHPETKAGTGVDLALQPGDILYVPQQEGKVSVTGDGIRQPGSLYFHENLNLLDAIAASGNINVDTADLPASTLTRGGVKRKVDFQALLKDGDPKANVALEPGDIINIPELHNRTYVFGSVAKPGWYYYKPNDRIQDALNGAGGPYPNADLGKINLIHTYKQGTEATLVRVNLNEYLLKGNIVGNPHVAPGDSLYIPKQRERVDLGTIFGAITGVGAAANGVRVLQGH